MSNVIVYFLSNYDHYIENNDKNFSNKKILITKLIIITTSTLFTLTLVLVILKL